MQASHQTFLVAVLAVTPFISVTAQQRLPVKPGDQVRIIAATGVFDLRGAFTVVAVRADSLVVRREPNTWSVPNAAITRIEVRRGKSRAGRGALIGVLVGGVAGAIIGYATYERPEPESESQGPVSFESASFTELFGCFGCSDVTSPELAAFGGAILLGAFGAGIGAVTGAFLFKTHGWVPVPLNRLRVSVAPQRDGRFAFGLSVRF